MPGSRPHVPLKMDGLDPETMAEDELEGASTAIRRAIDVLNPLNQEGEWRHRVLEVPNISTRCLGPPRSSPSRRATPPLFGTWSIRPTVTDGAGSCSSSILWVFSCLPRFRERSPLPWKVWRLRDSSEEAVFELRLLREQARMFRRTMKFVEENLMAFAVRRPKMGFGFELSRKRRPIGAVASCEPAFGRAHALPCRAPLVTQVALSSPDDSS